ncbi:DUF2971 domain-containing protein [Aestuariibacter sp. AA17]|uniref:DUF2971 domain-containing protein n=1 Tax=Fluctibacter corallii TaxID=2984329 RepID=A0ABT3A7Y0_9ALTE|nr:DUF2971 domain-containing protein [Aestuariibacter sp. AA17]MCV2884796.1 DUF2971 domain-containing protein [Aestuariibacter sp. AA17]
MSALNDPFESSFLLNLRGLDQLLKESAEEAWKLWENLPKYEKTEENRNSVRRVVEELNEFKEEKFNSKTLGNNLRDTIERNIGILSLSKTNENLLMWSHYAQNHQGFVIGFNEEHDFFFQKKLTK